jgi:cytochrome b6-f complex iron-sulfur subunit
MMSHESSPDKTSTDSHCDPACPNQGRRNFVRACIGGASVVTVGTVTYPMVAFLNLPQRVGGNKPVEIPLDRLAVGQAHYAEFQGKQIIVLMGEDGPRVLDAACTHLGCNVVWETAQGNFHCPCHGALFSADGKVVAGPVSAPLRPVPFEIKDGVLVIS